MKNKKKLFPLLALLLLLAGSSRSFAQFSQNEECEALIKTIQNGDSNQAMLLLKSIDANCESIRDGTPLIAASRSGNLSMVAVLVTKYKADVNKGVLGDGNPLIQSSRKGDLYIAAYLIENGADVNAIVQEDETPLINAAARGHLKMVKLLVSKGADVNKSVWSNSPSGNELRTPLFMAVRNSHAKVVKFLLEEGANR